MNLLRVLLPAVLLLILGCASTPEPTTDSSRQEFRRLCKSLGVKGDRISKEEFLSKVIDRESAAKIFEACDANKDGYITEEEARADYLESMKSQAIRLTTPPLPSRRGF